MSIILVSFMVLAFRKRLVGAMGNGSGSSSAFPGQDHLFFLGPDRYLGVSDPAHEVRVVVSLLALEGSSNLDMFARPNPSSYFEMS